MCLELLTCGSHLSPPHRIAPPDPFLKPTLTPPHLRSASPASSTAAAVARRASGATVLGSTVRPPLVVVELRSRCIWSGTPHRAASTRAQTSSSVCRPAVAGAPCVDDSQLT